MRYRDLWNFIYERYRIYERKSQGKRKPWTKDPILQSYRFCNVHRENDTVTRWISDNWRTPHRDDQDLWFAMVVARLLNWPPTLEALGYPVPWNPGKFITIVQDIQRAGGKAFGGAYIVSTNGRRMDKAEYLATEVLGPMWENRRNLRPTQFSNLVTYHMTLMGQQGMGSFMAAQVVADLKYVEPLCRAADWYTFAASGPGSRRGMNYLLDRDPDSPWREADWKAELDRLHAKIEGLAAKAGMPPIHAQDLQNCLCEFSKFMKVKMGHGRPKATYPGV